MLFLNQAEKFWHRFFVSKVVLGNPVLKHRAASKTNPWGSGFWSEGSALHVPPEQTILNLNTKSVVLV